MLFTPHITLFSIMTYKGKRNVIIFLNNSSLSAEIQFYLRDSVKKML